MKYEVDFIGDNSIAILPQTKIHNFLEHKQSHSQTKKKNLLGAIEKALEMAKEQEF